MRVALITLLLVALATSAPAAEGRQEEAGALEARSATFEGSLDVTLLAAILAAEPGAALIVEAERVVFTIQWSRSVTDPEGDKEVLLEYGNQTSVIAPARFRVDVDDASGFAVVTAPQASALGDRLHVSPAPRESAYRLRANGTHPDQHVLVVAPVGTLAVSARIGVDAPDALLESYGATFAGDVGARVGTRKEASSPFSPINVSFARVALTGARITLDGDATRAFAAEATVVGEGVARFAGAAGSVSAGPREHEVVRSLEAEGRFEARAVSRGADPPLLPTGQGSPRPPSWSVSGDFTRLRADGLALIEAPVAVASVAAGAAIAWAFHGLYSRIPDDSVLRHPTRRRILDLVCARPGIVQSGAQRDLDLTWGAFSYHLRVLGERRLVRRVRAGRVVRLYPTTGSPEAERGEPSGRAAVILDLVRSRDGVTAREIAAELGIAHQLAYHHLSRLKELGRVRVEPGRPARYREAAAPRREPQDL